MAGKSNLEVRPQFVNKGYIATRLVNEYGKQAGEPPEFVLCLGDDQTDEGERSRIYSGFSPVSNEQNLDMFQALLNTDLPKDQVFAVTVGASSKRTLASWHLLAPTDVIASIAALNAPRYSGESQRDGQVAL
jgi:trehalose 6-phosphate synthase/phosphatase